MSLINENFLELQESYLFSTINKKVSDYAKTHPDKKIIKLGIGDVTRPLAPAVVEALKTAALELGTKEGFKGYGPEQGYDFLRQAIIDNEYLARNINLSKDEIFISDGAKCDSGNIGDIFSKDNIVAIPDPVYPVYLDTNVMAGRSGKFNKSTGKYENIYYLPMNKENNFKPELPTKKVDLIYLCSPNNPTGTVLTKEDLTKWVNYAIENNSIILFDAAYEAFITDPSLPHSIYEIEGAKKVCIEFKSFSKTAGFTGIRCAYLVIPKELKGFTKDNQEISLNKLWNRRTTTKFNGASYIVQKAAEATYTEKGQKQIRENINYYLENVKIIKKGLEKAGYEVYGGENSPYVWLKVPANMTSWEFFDYLLEKLNIVGTPGSGFGPNGEGYFRLTAFGTRENTIEAINRIEQNISKQ